jgi:ectoine hydroxylase-related dioxygenase (phytanoyl-CoA dioxygenase family)
MLIQFGYRQVEYPSEQMGELVSSNDLLADVTALRERMDRDGYLLLRNLIDRDKVLQARRTVLQYMADHQALTPGEPLLEGVMPAGGRSVQLMGFKGISHHPDVLAVVESEELFSFFAQYFGEPALTFTYKWLRGVGNEKYTGAHYDVVYMGRGSENLHTVWIPFGDTPVEHGTLAVCAGSHNSPNFARLRQTYGRIDVDRDLHEGWFSKDPMEIVEKFGGGWQTSNFIAGDVILFGMYTMHASTTNVTNRFRLSCDVRFQPAGDPMDERWGGKNPIGYVTDKPIHTMADSRAKWEL